MIISQSGKQKNGVIRGKNELYYSSPPFFSLEVYGAKVTTLRAEVGSRPTNEALKEALNEKKYKMVTVTHVDTS